MYMYMLYWNLTLHVHAEALKLPSFWFTSPAIWFAQVEAQFMTRQHPIEANLTKYKYVVAALDNVEVEALILSPPVVNKYSTPAWSRH